jgi:hypothetical protein
MTTIACVPPEVLKRILELKGYKLKRETKYNWTFVLPGAPEDDPRTVVIPKRGDLVAVEVMMGTLVAAHILPGDYFILKAQVDAEVKKKAN